MKQEKRAPKRRFRKFAEAGEWKYVTLADIADVVGGGTPDTENKEYWDGDIDWYTPSEIGVHAFVDGSIRKISATGLANSSAQMLPAEKTVLFTSRASIGDAAILRHEGTTNQGFQSLVTKDDVDPYFLYSLTGKIKNYALQQAAGSTFIEVSGKNLGQCPLVIPSPREQQTIGEFCRQLDDIISLHERKLQKLEHLKQAYLTEMFPAKDERQPRRRFKGFSGDWELVQLRDVTEQFEYGLNVAAMPYDGKNKYIRITDIDDDTHHFNTGDLTTPDCDLSLAPMYLLQENDIVFARTGASVGKTYLYRPEDGRVYYAGFLIRARIRPEISAGFVFLNTLTGAYRDFIEITSQRSGQPGVNAQEYGTYSFYLPCYEEQEKIAAFFAYLDRIYTSESQKLAKLRALKQAYLSELFV